MSPAQKTHILHVLQRATKEVDECKLLFKKHKTSCRSGDCCTNEDRSVSNGKQDKGSKG